MSTRCSTSAAASTLKVLHRGKRSNSRLPIEVAGLRIENGDAEAALRGRFDLGEPGIDVDLQGAAARLA